MPLCGFVWLRRASRPQFALIRKACEAYGLEMIEGAGYEADDVIASLALEVCVGSRRDQAGCWIWRAEQRPLSL